MLVSEWLRGLNLQKYTPKFHADGFRRVGDLRRVTDGELQGYGMTAFTDRQRVMDMISPGGSEEAR